MTWAGWVRGAEVEPSIYAANFADLGTQLRGLLTDGARIFHCDVGDGHFIREITIGPVVLASISNLVHHRGGVLDCHLMVSEPERHFESVKDAGGDSVTFHVEVAVDPAKTIARARELGLGVGVAFNPETPVALAVAAAEGADLALCMSIHPGLSGQKFMPEALGRIAELKTKLPAGVLIQVDGGVHAENAQDRPRGRRRSARRRRRCLLAGRLCSRLPRARGRGWNGFLRGSSRAMTARALRRPVNHVIVLFGATGDLARRKIIPGLFHLAAAGLMPEDYRIIGASRTSLSDDEIRASALLSLTEFGDGRTRKRDRIAFIRRIYGTSHEGLVSTVQQAEREIGGRPRRLYHLAIPPSAFPSMLEMLAATKLDQRARVIIEKPFGTDLHSARALNKVVHAGFSESEIFRIDHFLGKESVDNILAFRFANGLFEPVWNREHIDHVQIDVPEMLSIEGRASFYEGTGAFRDMIVTHLFQVLGFVAMEPPTSLDPKALRSEKNKVFEAMKPLDPADVVRGQYRGYRDEPGVSRRSGTETFAALRVEIDNWRWAGVPFYLRTGKSLAESRQSIVLAFREPPLRMFKLAHGLSHSTRPNELLIEFRDPGSISTRFLAKVPGPAMDLSEATMTFSYGDSFGAGHLEAYERLLRDAMLGDQTLFTDAAGIERLWEVSTPVLERPGRIHPYAPGSWGPRAAETLILPHYWSLPDGSSPPGGAAAT